jgi:hypothetical protein
MFWAMASTLSGTCKKELSCPTRVVERSLCLRYSSKASRLTRQCLPTFRHGKCPSRHQRHTVVSLTPISAATSSALSRSLSSGRAMVPSFCTFQGVFAICLLYSLFARF